MPDLERSVAFYSPVLEVLGITTLLAVPADPEHDQLAMHGYGVGFKPFFWLVEQAYYGAFVLDPDGVSLEAVCHAPT